MMPGAGQIRDYCKRGAARVGATGLLFLASLAGFALFYETGWSALSLMVCALVGSVTGVLLLLRLTRYLMKHSLWSLRNRLLVVYALIGILPIVLILALVGVGLWSLMTELAIYLASSELDRRVTAVRGAAEYVEHIPADVRKYAVPEVLKAFVVRFPGIHIYTEDATGRHSYPVGSPELHVPTGWGDVSGLLDRDQKFYAWAHFAREGESISVLVPVTDAFVADLVPNLGRIVLSDTPHGKGGNDLINLDSSKNPDFEYRDGKWKAKKQSDKSPGLAVHNAGKIPPPMNRLDVELTYFAFYPHYDWNDPNHKHSAILVIRSRPSAVFSAIFTGTDQLRSLLVNTFIIVAILFLIVEVIALIVGVSLSKRVTRAVNELYEGTRRVIYGDFRHRILVRGTDQIGELTTSFNQMTGNLERLLSVEKEKERLQAELEIAREVQTQLYPRSVPPSQGLKLTVYCEPARVVSGDYYDYETVSCDKMAFAIGDVAGKGISAALLMATVQAALRAQIAAGLVDEGTGEAPTVRLDSAKLVSELNRQIYAHTAPEKYATFFFAMYDSSTATLTYTNAGHLPPVLIRRGETVTFDTNGTVVGAFPTAQYDQSRIGLEHGDLLVCYTDGITEPENAYGEMFGEDRLIDLVKRSAHEDDQTIIKKVIEAVRNWHSEPELPDDMTLLIARCENAA